MEFSLKGPCLPPRLSPCCETMEKAPSPMCLLPRARLVKKKPALHLVKSSTRGDSDEGDRSYLASAKLSKALPSGVAENEDGGAGSSEDWKATGRRCFQLSGF